MSVSIPIGARRIGARHPCYIIAEVGVNHDGDMAVAHRLIDTAASAGADAVKFQTFDPAQLVSPTGAAAPYQQAAVGRTTQRDMLAALALPDAAWPELAVHARTVGLDFLSTPFDLRSAELLADLGVPALKIPSGELTNLPLIRAIAGFSLPLLISTGMSDIDEVAAAVEAAESAPAVAIFHCVSAYPAEEEDANLRAIVTMRQHFEVPVGWSDHTPGSLTGVVAVALGAAMLEKHLTLDRTRPGPDHKASVDPRGLADYVDLVRRTERSLGDGIKRPKDAELVNREAGRRSWHATRNLEAGHVVTTDDITALRPGVGISPAQDLIGTRLRRSVASGSPIHAGDIGPTDEPR